MREIEVKARLRNKEELLAAAEKRGIKFGKEIHQADKTYRSDIPRDDPSWNLFRLREEDGRTLLTMKFRASDQAHDHHEFETEVQDSKEIEGMLKRLGYNLDVYINKKRRKAKHNGLEFCVDEVDRLGSFIEVEKLAEEDADVHAVQNELWEILKSLGVQESDRTDMGYDSQMRKLEGKDTP